MFSKFIKHFKLNSTSKFYIISIFLILILLTTLTVIAFRTSYSAAIAEIRMQMMEVAITLEQQFDAEYASIEDIIVKRGVDSSAREEKIIALNSELQPLIDDITGTINGDIHLCFLWIEEQAIIACGPGCDPYSLNRVDLNTPAFEAYRTGTS